MIAYEGMMDAQWIDDIEREVTSPPPGHDDWGGGGGRNTHLTFVFPGDDTVGVEVQGQWGGGQVADLMEKLQRQAVIVLVDADGNQHIVITRSVLSVAIQYKFDKDDDSGGMEL